MATTISIDASQEGAEPSFSIQNHSEGLWRRGEGDYVETHEGVKHRFQDVVLTDEHLEGSFDFTSYASDLNTAYPSLQSAIAWAAKGNAHGFDVAGFNAAIDNQDLTEINAGAERLIALYQEANQAPPEQIPDDDDDESDEDEFTDLDDWFVENVTDEFIEETIDQISDSSFTSDQVTAMEDLSSSYEPGSVESAILQLGVAIGNGSMTGDDAIAWALENYSESQLAAAYIQLSQQLN